MSRLQCHYCKRWLEVTPKDVKYYETATHPVMCGRCVNEAEKEYPYSVVVIEPGGTMKAYVGKPKPE